MAGAEELLTTRIAQIIVETKEDALKVEEEGENPGIFVVVEAVEEDEGFLATNAIITHHEPQHP